MWLPTRAFDLFRISHATVDAQREELAQLRAERDALKISEATAKANFSWLTLRVNALEVERAQLLKKAFNIDVVVPEIVQTSNQRAGVSNLIELSTALFEDIGDVAAKEAGLPTYN
jgi:hypothetical protein